MARQLPRLAGLCYVWTMFKWLTDRRNARQEAQVLIAAHGARALHIARERVAVQQGRATRRDCLVVTEVRKLLGLPEHVDTGTRYGDAD